MIYFSLHSAIIYRLLTGYKTQ